VEVQAGTNLIAEAKDERRAALAVFSPRTSDPATKTQPVRAYEELVRALRASGLSFTGIRPVRLFTALHDIARLTARGLAW